MSNELLPIFDSHAHYDSEQFDSDRDALLGRVLPERGVVGILNMGSDIAGCEVTLDLCRRYDYIYGAVGIHPECAKDLLTDSRSFLSYARHDYFRRILCNIIGDWVENGEYPNFDASLKKIVEGICYNNAARYFGL